MSELDRIFREYDGIDTETRELINKISSRQRHDFMNMLQIMTGYLQIDMYDKALTSALEYGLRTESIGRLMKHGLTMTSQIVEYYLKIFSNNERKIEIINSLPPTDQMLRTENREALRMLDDVLERCSNSHTDRLILNFELFEKQVMIRILAPEVDEFEFMDLVIKYNNSIRRVEAGVVRTDSFWDYIEFAIAD